VVEVGIVVVVVVVDVGEVRKPVTEGQAGRTTVVVTPLVITIETELWPRTRAESRRAGRTERIVLLLVVLGRNRA
jgi:hypothetical protein